MLFVISHGLLAPAIVSATAVCNKAIRTGKPPPQQLPLYATPPPVLAKPASNQQRPTMATPRPAIAAPRAVQPLPEPTWHPADGDWLIALIAATAQSGPDGVEMLQNLEKRFVRNMTVWWRHWFDGFPLPPDADKNVLERDFLQRYVDARHPAPLRAAQEKLREIVESGANQWRRVAPPAAAVAATALAAAAADAATASAAAAASATAASPAAAAADPPETAASSAAKGPPGRRERPRSKASNAKRSEWHQAQQARWPPQPPRPPKPPPATR